MSLHAPPIDLLSDDHIHTRFCHHAIGEMEEYVLAAINKGLKEICFLEHMEAGIRYPEITWLTEEDFDLYFSEGKRLRGKYPDQITIGLGVEVGYNPECSEELLERLSGRQWDRIGVSFHYANIPGHSHHLNLLSRKEENIRRARDIGPEWLLSNYFEVLTEAVCTLPGTVLCHLDAALRYIPGLRYSVAHLDQIEQLLRAVKSRGMAAEINTSGLPIRGEPFPALTVLRMIMDHGIPLVAGSDAHRPEDVGRSFDMLEEYITSAVSPSPPRETWR